MHLISSARKTLLCIQLILLYSFCFVPMAFLVEYDQYCTKKGMRKKEAERISIQDKTINFPNAFLNFYQKLLKITTATLRCTPFTSTAIIPMATRYSEVRFHFSVKGGYLFIFPALKTCRASFFKLQVKITFWSWFKQIVASPQILCQKQCFGAKPPNSEVKAEERGK